MARLVAIGFVQCASLLAASANPPFFFVVAPTVSLSLCRAFPRTTSALPLAPALSPASPEHSLTLIPHSSCAQTDRATYHFKLVLLGNAGVGKSSLVLRFVRNEFYEDQETTIGAAFLTQTVSLTDATVKFEIWDTAGQERYRSLAPMYYRGAAAAIVVFSVTDKESFVGAKTWVKELMRRGDPNVVIVLAGNKADLVHKRDVAREEAEEYATENDLFYIETSARDSTNVRELFTEIANRLPKHAQAPKKDLFAQPPKKSGCC